MFVCLHICLKSPALLKNEGKAILALRIAFKLGIMNLKFPCEYGGVTETKKCNKYAYENKSEMHRHHKEHIHMPTYLFFNMLVFVGTNNYIKDYACNESTI